MPTTMQTCPPLDGTRVLFLNVDHDGVTADGERFDVDPVVYRAHARIEDVVIRFPDGKLKLVQRVTPARQLV